MKTIKFPDELHRKGIMAYKKAKVMMKNRQKNSLHIVKISHNGGRK